MELAYSYAREDGPLRDELDKHLANLKRRGLIAGWYDRDIAEQFGRTDLRPLAPNPKKPPCALSSPTPRPEGGQLAFRGVWILGS